MIEINLLPKELRKRNIELPNIFTHISFIPVVALILGIHLLLVFAITMKARTLARHEKRWQEILPEKEEADKLRDELTKMRGKIEVVDSLVQGRISWAKKLSDLSDAIIQGVWLNRLWLDQKIVLEMAESIKNEEGGAGVSAAPKRTIVKTLHLNGSVIASGGEETAAIGKFIRSLKNNKGYSADFKEIEATSIQRSHLKDVEVMDFELICYFK